MSIADIGYGGNKEPLNYTGNTHGGMCEVNGQWYIFYHRQTNRVKCCRQGCAEKLTILPDGSIPQVEVTSCGLNDGALSGKGKYEARIACNLGSSGEMIKSDEAMKKDKRNLLPFFTQSGEDSGDQYIANMRDKSWCGFKYFAFDGTESKLTVTVRGEASGVMKMYTDRSLPPVTSVQIDPSAEWTDLSGDCEITCGTSPICFVFEGSGYLDFASFEIS